MGSAIPPTDELSQAILDLCPSARRTGKVIDVAQEAAQLLKAFPNDGKDKVVIGEAIVREAALHHGVNLLLNWREG